MHIKIMSSSNFAGIIVALFWERRAGQCTKLQYILGPEFDIFPETEAVTDTFHVMPAKRGKYSIHISQLYLDDQQLHPRHQQSRIHTA